MKLMIEGYKLGVFCFFIVFIVLFSSSVFAELQVGINDGLGINLGGAEQNIINATITLINESDPYAVKGSGTSGYLSLWNSSGTLTDSGVFYNSTTKYVGLGTSSPDSGLEISSSSTTLSRIKVVSTDATRTINPSIAFERDNGAYVGYIVGDSATRSLYLGGGSDVGTITVASGGNVGIGTSSLLGRLTVSGGSIIFNTNTAGDEARVQFSALPVGNRNETFTKFSNGANWGLMTLSDGNTPRIGAYDGGKVYIQGFNTSSGTYSKSPLTTFDLSNEKVGIGTTSPNYTLSVGSTDGSDEVNIYHDDSNAYFRTTDGTFNFITDEGTNTHTYLMVQGKGTGRAYIRAYDEDNSVYAESLASNNYGYFRVQGGATALTLQNDADVPIWVFPDSASGETQEFNIYGYRTGDAKRSLQIGVGVDANDTASFDGVSNYLFDGNVTANNLYSEYLKLFTSNPEIEFNHSSGYKWKVGSYDSGSTFKIISPSNANVINCNKDSASCTLQNLKTTASYNGVTALETTLAEGMVVDSWTIKNSSGSVVFAINNTDTQSFIKMRSPDGTLYSCGVADGGAWSCS